MLVSQYGCFPSHTEKDTIRLKKKKFNKTKKIKLYKNCWIETHSLSLCVYFFILSFLNIRPHFNSNLGFFFCPHFTLTFFFWFGSSSRSDRSGLSSSGSSRRLMCESLWRPGGTARSVWVCGARWDVWLISFFFYLVCGSVTFSQFCSVYLLVGGKKIK